MNLPEAREKFIQSWGSLGSQWGINKTMAQIHALLLISAEPLTTEEVMEELQVSRGNANINLRELINWQLVRRETKAGERKDFFVAEKETIIGIALYYIKYSTWKGKCIFLEDLIVTEEFRKYGIGKKLFDEVVNVTKEMKAARLEWQVLEWNEPAIKFYKKLNSNFDKEWINCKLTGEQIQNYK